MGGLGIPPRDGPRSPADWEDRRLIHEVSSDSTVAFGDDYVEAWLDALQACKRMVERRKGEEGVAAPDDETSEKGE